MNFNAAVSISAVTLVLATAGPASAEIVHLTSGSSLSVKNHRIDGDTIILTLRGGGEVTCDKNLIEKIEADEVPYPDPADARGAQDTPAPAASASALSLLETTPYGEIISSVSQAHGVDPMLVRALIQVESGYRPKARSPKGAMGLMQLMPSTAREYKVRNAYDPRANIAAGVQHLRTLIDKFGVELALAAYNAGPGAVKKFKGIPPYRETRKYVARILSIRGPDSGIPAR